MVTTKANAIPFGFDKYAAGDIDEEVDALTVGAVIADGLGKRYVNVLELLAARLDEAKYVIRGRIERSSWRDESDSWVNILMVHDQRGWSATEEENWSAERVDPSVAEAHPKPAKPSQSFEAWRKDYMVKWQEQEDKAEKAFQDTMAARELARQREQRGIKCEVRCDGQCVLRIDGDAFDPSSTVSEKWRKSGNSIKKGDGSVKFENRSGTIRSSKSGDASHGWKISGNSIEKIGGGTTRFELDGNKVTAPGGGRLTITGETMDMQTLAFALVAMGYITPEE